MPRARGSPCSDLPLLLALCAGCSWAPAAAPPPAPSSPPLEAPRRTAGQHLLLVVEVSPAGGRVLDARRVNAPLPRSPAPVHPAWTVEVLGDDGGLLHQLRLEAPDLVRGEFPASDGGYQRFEVRQETSVVALRLPLSPAAATVRISAARGGRPGSAEARLRGEDVDLGDAVLATVPYPRALP